MDRVYDTLKSFIAEYPEEFRAVRAILIEYWDPIDDEAHRERAEDEYDYYVPQVVFFALGGKSAVVIADHLAEVQAGLLGYESPTPQQWLRCKKAADAIVEYFEKRGPKAKP